VRRGTEVLSDAHGSASFAREVKRDVAGLVKVGVAVTVAEKASGGKGESVVEVFHVCIIGQVSAA
jgi:hypothetical protein